MTHSLQDIVLAVATNLRDCIQSAATSTAGDSVSLVDASLKLFSTGSNRFAGSECLFLNGAAPSSGVNPLTVNGFTNTTGTLTFTASYGSAVPSGTAYALLNVGGQGNPYQAILSALDMAFAALNLKAPATDQDVTVTAATDGWANHDLTVPAGLDWLTRVELTRTAPYRTTIGRRFWSLLPGTRTLRINQAVCLYVGDVVTLGGYADVVRPAALADTVDVNLEQVVNMAIEYLLRDSKDRDEQTLVANLYGDRLRTVNAYRLPSSVRVG